MEEIRDFSKQIDFNSLIYHYKSKNVPKIILSFKGPLKFYKKIREGNTTLEKTKDEQKEFKLEFNKIVNGSKKSENQKSAINNIKTL